VVEKTQDEEFTRSDVCRKLGLSERQLRAWEKLGMVAAAEAYSFSDLIALKTLVKLREKRIPNRQIGRALDALRRKLPRVKHPLSELRIVSDGRTIAVKLPGEKMEAISGQLLFDFETADLRSVRAFPDRQPEREAVRLRDAEAWFQKGLECEETGAPVEQAIEAYRKSVELNPDAAGAWVNLGTIQYRQRRFNEAEAYYQKALEADPNYALAEFNLGNLYDEQGRLPEALQHYRRSLEVNPNYADAQFNLALLSERTGDVLKAVHYWKTYLKLDSTGHWADIARRQLDRLRQATLIKSR
jgi:tetratricopeptide (TPR) repeat protein